MLLNFIRSWKRRIQGVKIENRVMLYHGLYSLLTELNATTFSSLIQQFLKYWKSIEPEFTEYFSQYYANRPGTLYIP